MQVLEDLPVRPQHRSPVIGDRVLLTKGFDEALCFSQTIAGHAWEEMVLDLVVESSIPEVRHGMRFHIARSHHLAVQEAQVALFVSC
jgi:hypothetical protein